MAIEEQRKRRWNQVEQSAARMRNGEFPAHGHVYVVNSSEEKSVAVVIYGTRRMLAYLESGYNEMPVVALVIEESKGHT